MPEPKIKPISMRANFIWTMLGNIVYSGSNWLTLVILAKLCALVLVGRYSLGLAVCAPIFAFADLRLRAIQSTDTKSEFNFCDYLMLRLITTAISIIIVLALVILTDYHLPTKYVIVAVALIFVFESLGDIHFGVFQFYESMDKIAVSMALKGIISIISLTLIVHFTRSVLNGVLITAASYALIVFLYDIPNARQLMRNYQKEYVYFAFNKKNIIKLAKTAFPLGVSTSINTFQSKVPTYFIMGAFGERQVGIFSAMIALIGLSDRIINALGQSAGPRLAKLFAANKTSDFKKLLMKLVFIGIAVGVSGMLISLLFGKQILTIVYNKGICKSGLYSCMVSCCGGS